MVDPVTMTAVTTLVSTVITWLTPLMLAILIRVQLKNGKLQREEAAAAVLASSTVAEKVEKVAKVAAVAASKVQQVAETAAMTTKRAAQQSDQILVLAGQTHTLVNSKMGLQLKKNARKARDMATAVPTPENIKDA